MIAHDTFPRLGSEPTFTTPLEEFRSRNTETQVFEFMVSRDLIDIDREILSYIPDDELLMTCSVNKRFYYSVCDDREILSYIPDDELLMTCSVNKRFFYSVCDDAFLKRRIKKYLDFKNIETDWT